MAKTTAKTIETTNNVSDFIKSFSDQEKQADCFRLIEIMKEQSGFEPKMWGPAIVGFGSYHYKYESGHEGDAPLVSFSPRKDAISLYLTFDMDQKQELLKTFGKYKMAKSCIYVKQLTDIKIPILNKMITASIKYLQNKHIPS
jgi:hypothetical protein